MLVLLSVLKSPIELPKFFPLENFVCTIGKNRNASFRIELDWVSGLHCNFCRSDRVKHFELFDGGAGRPSTNGTFLVRGEETIQASFDKGLLLQFGDLICLGRSRAIVFLYSEDREVKPDGTQQSD